MDFTDTAIFLFLIIIMNKLILSKSLIGIILLFVSQSAWLQTVQGTVTTAEYGSGPLAAVQAASGALTTGAVITLTTVGVALIAAKNTSSSSTTTTTK